MHRRNVLRAIAALAAFPALPLAAATGATFDYAWLKGRARTLAAGAYHPIPERIPEALGKLDWDQYQAIRMRPDHALWANSGSRFSASFFHLGLNFRQPVRINVVENGRAQAIAYDPAMFDHRRSGLSGVRLPADLGFAGFRVSFHTDPLRDVFAFLGASYFRAVGGEMQYGLSARGLAVDCGMPRPEEFPVFTEFWLERPAPDAGTLVVYALLDSPSIAGAYRFAITPGETLVMDVDAALYPRRPIERLGIAPLTSMYLHGENDQRVRDDWRPEIHDSDGLALWTGRGERIWRPLTNPAALRFNAYADENPRGFGLLQRDRAFDHYQDDGAFYDRRPGLWVEPRSNWGKGAVHLVELPTPDETFDNIVAFWNPAAPPQPGEELLYAYRLHWGAQTPDDHRLARTIATRTGRGGVVGQPRRYFSWRFIVDFDRGAFPMLGAAVAAKLEPVITASRGRVEIVAVRPLNSSAAYRVSFDVVPEAGDPRPIDLRVFLRANGEALSETWMYQWTPPG